MNIYYLVVLLYYVHFFFFRFQYLSLTRDQSSGEELNCPLCQLHFSNGTSMQKHFMNYQHIERYKVAKNELQLHYQGPYSNIKNL